MNSQGPPRMRARAQRPRRELAGNPRLCLSPCSTPPGFPKSWWETACTWPSSGRSPRSRPRPTRSGSVSPSSRSALCAISTSRSPSWSWPGPCCCGTGWTGSGGRARVGARGGLGGRASGTRLGDAPRGTRLGDAVPLPGGRCENQREAALGFAGRPLRTFPDRSEAKAFVSEVAAGVRGEGLARPWAARGPGLLRGTPRAVSAPRSPHPMVLGEYSPLRRVRCLLTVLAERSL